MAERLPRRSTSPDSIVSEFSSHDSTTTAPPSFSLSVGPPLRSSQTLANLCHANDALDSQSLFLDDFGSKLSSDMRRWQSNAENLNQPFSPKPTYLVNDSLTNTNVPTSSMYDVLVGPRARLPASASLASIRHSIYAVNNQQSSLSAMTHSTDQLTMSNENLSPFSSASLFLPLPTPNRPLLSAMENIPDNDQQRVPYLLMGMSSSSPSPTYGSHLPRHEHNLAASSPSSQQPAPQVFRSAGRTNSMASWRGYLPTRFERMALDPITSYYSQKLFLGGIPAEVTEAELLLVLRAFGKCNIKWPKNDGVNENMPGFCHVIYRESRSVCELLRHCTRQQGSTIDYFLHIHMSTPSPMTSLPTTRTSRLKPIQVVPWNVRDNVYVMQEGDIATGELTGKDWSRTIFVSPLHGKMTSYSLATIMAYVFGPVSMAQINTDKYGYPTGTGTVLFSDSHSYMRAVAAGAIDIKCDCFHKLLDIDPFLRENETCAYCLAPADRFCRNFHCLRSYCEPCWKKKHGPKPLADHQPATRRQQPLHHL